MTEEEIKALVEAKEAAEKEAADAKLAATAAEEKARLDAQKFVNEITDLRKKKQEAEAKASLSNGELDVSALIEQALESKEQQSRKASFEEALAEFKAAKPEFQADAAGLVFARFESGLSRFNFSDIGTKEQMKARLEEVYRFQNFKPSQDESLDYEGSPSNAMPVGQVTDGPSKDTKSALEFAGIDEGRYKELKSKYPDALNSLGI